MASLRDAEARDAVKGLYVGELMELLTYPERNPELYAALDNVFANGRRLMPTRVMFSGVRTR